MTIPAARNVTVELRKKMGAILQFNSYYNLKESNKKATATILK